MEREITASLQETQAPTDGSGNFFPASAGRPQSREKSSATNGSSSGLQPLPQRVERTPAREPSTSASFAERRPGSEPRRSESLHHSTDSTLQSALREMRQTNVDDSHLNAEEFTALYAPLHEGSARYPPWLQRLPWEYDGKSLLPPTRTAGGAVQQRDPIGYLFSRLLFWPPLGLSLGVFLGYRRGPFSFYNPIRQGRNRATC